MEAVYLLAVNVPRGEARILEVDIDRQGAYPLDPGESVASEHDTRPEAEAAWEEFHGVGPVRSAGA